MGLNTPFRKQSFRSRFPTHEAFLEARARSAAAGSTLVESSRVVPSAFEVAEAIGSGRIPPGLSSRMMSDSMLKAARSRIVSEHEGLIQQLLLTVPRGYETAVDAKDERHFKTLLSALGPGIEYVVVHHPNQRKIIESWFADARIPLRQLRLVSSPVFEYSIWAQDAYVAVRDVAGTTILCESVAFTRLEDMTVADDVAAQTDISSLSSYLYFQGGNVLGGSTWTLMGLDYIWLNTSRYLLETEPDVVSSFENLWNTRVLPLGGYLASNDTHWWKDKILSGDGLQPLFHIDMYVTPTAVPGKDGKPIAMLGSPEAAFKILGRWNDAGVIDGDVYDSFFAETEKQLAAHFDVRKVPLWLVHGNLNQPGFQMRYYVLTWNNSVVQDDGKSRKVLVPNFADPQDCFEYGVDLPTRQKLQVAAEKVWTDAGFEVSRMDGLEDLAYRSGCVHCITKVLKRI